MDVTRNVTDAAGLVATQVLAAIDAGAPLEQLRAGLSRFVIDLQPADPTKTSPLLLRLSLPPTAPSQGGA